MRVEGGRSAGWWQRAVRDIAVALRVRADDRADVALVVVHGMGHSQTGDTLLEWSEPILGRADWLTKNANRSPGTTAQDIRGDTAAGVTIVDSVMSADAKAYVVADVAWRNTAQGVKHRRIAILEARWSESFVPMGRRDVFKWGVRFLWRTLGRMGVHFTATFLVIPSLGFRRIRHVANVAIGVAIAVQASLLTIAGLFFTGATWAVLFALGIVGSIVLPLLSPLLLIPIVHKWIQSPVDGLVDFVGDVASYRERPLRAAAMRVVFVARLRDAFASIKPDGEVAVVAHSQGAVIVAKALLSELNRAEFPVARLSTLGAPLALLGDTRFRRRVKGSDKRYGPVQNWIDNARQMEWKNYWAIWDPFSAGPVGDRYPNRWRRWQGSYVEGSGNKTPGPEEHAVHNTSSPLTDHQSYAKNTLQVIEPIVRELLGSDFPAAAPAEHEADAMQFVSRRRARGVGLIASLVIAVSLGVSPWLQSFLLDELEQFRLWINELLEQCGIEFDLDLSAFVSDATCECPARLTPLAIVLVMALLTALLVWTNLSVADRGEKQQLWPMGFQRSASGRIAGEVIVQSLYVGSAAALAVASGVDAWPESAGLLPWTITVAATTVVLTLISIYKGRVPLVVAANQV